MSSSMPAGLLTAPAEVSVHWWPCAVCGEWRYPFEATTVARRRWTTDLGVEVEQRVVHCADRPACAIGADQMLSESVRQAGADNGQR